MCSPRGRPIPCATSRNWPSPGSASPWSGRARGVAAATGVTRVVIDPVYFRPTEVDRLLGDATKARERLGWRHTVSFEALVAEMVDADREPSMFEVA